jgi:Holliday junction DNA helicase RuvB
MSEVFENKANILNPNEDSENFEVETVIRPQKLVDFFGQPKAVEILSVTLSGSRKRGLPPNHTLLYGPPGLGKTTLAQILANESGGEFRSISAPTIQRAGDLASVLVDLPENCVFFIDEIHRLTSVAEEILYTAMEDFRIDIIAGEPGRSRPLRIDLNPFCLVGATTRPGMLSRPFRDRFTVDVKLELYSDEALAHIVERTAGIIELPIEAGVSTAIAFRSRGTPRIANRILQRVYDTVAHLGADVASQDIAERTFELLGVDEQGLNETDRRYLDILGGRFKGKAVGKNQLASILGEDIDTLEEEIEPWLLQKGFIEITPRGRILGNYHGDDLFK